MDLYSMIQNGAHFKVEVTSEDLVTFADRLITKSQDKGDGTGKQSR